MCELVEKKRQSTHTHFMCIGFSFEYGSIKNGWAYLLQQFNSINIKQFDNCAKMMPESF